MSVIKRFFEKRKLNVKFKKAGEGHRLDEQTSRPRTSCDGARPVPRAAPTDPDAAQKAADAALARLSNKSKDNTTIVRARMRTEMEAEKRKLKEAEAAMNQAATAAQASPRELTLDGAPMLPKVLYCCPEIGPEVLPKEEMEGHIQAFLYSSLVEDPEMTSAIMIHTLNKHPDKVKVCVETLIRYLDNAISHPEEEKYHKIRAGNKAFQERVACLMGTEEFMQAAGFVLRSLPHEDHEEHFWVLSEDYAKDSERLTNIKEVLLAAEPIRPQLDRALKVFHPSNKAAKFEIPDEFYNVSPAELKKEQQRKEEAVEKLGMLRTKAMRERDELKELRKYRFTLLRVRFPDGVLLQGIFKAHEKLSAVRQFVGEQLLMWLPFNLVTATGQRLTEDNASLAELNLAPAAVINFSWDEAVQADIAAQRGAHQAGPFLKPETAALIQSLQ
ncbi:UBX domain-containing protein 6-like [Babylonia areolata]|uniref:UBX domain-containing protein 6-like n=1 Tax=Babylonia areolata TaxID=304850 RepID=UPI003FD50826